MTLFGCETWALEKAEPNILEVWERKISRRIYGGKRVEEKNK